MSRSLSGSCRVLITSSSFKPGVLEQSSGYWGPELRNTVVKHVRVTTLVSVSQDLWGKQIQVQYKVLHREAGRIFVCACMIHIKHLAYLPSSCGFVGECCPVLRWTLEFLAPPQAFAVPHFPGGSTDSSMDKSSGSSCPEWYSKSLWIKYLSWSLLLFPSGCRSVQTWARSCTSLSFPLPLQQDGLPSGPILQRKVTHGAAEVFRFGVSHHSFGVAQE